MLEPNDARRNYLRSLVTGWGDTGVCFEKETICLDNLALLKPRVFIIGHLNTERTTRLLYAVKLMDFKLPVLVLTGEAEILTLISVNGFENTRGLSPAATAEDIKDAVENFKHLEREAPDPQGAWHWPMIIGSDPDIVKIKKSIFEIARSGEALLIQGERGSGKDLVARAVHFWSNRSEDEFIKVDSGAVTQDIFQNDLLKWFEIRSAFDEKVGAGQAEVYTGRTIFFDEIGQLAADLQGALLRLFEALEGELTSRLLPPATMRIIASTSDDLISLTETGRFRKDLFYRLNVFMIEIPPLRERRGDIPVLVDFFTDKYCREIGKGHYEVPRKARALYAEYDWPGNVREIETVVKRSVIVGDEGGFIESLCRCIQGGKQPFCTAGRNEGVPRRFDTTELRSYMKDLTQISLKEICREFIMRAEKRAMKQALDQTRWNRKKAAGLLNISYKSLLNKMKCYDLTV